MSVIRLGVAGHGGRVSSFIRHVLREAEPPAVRKEIRVVGIVDPDEAGARARLDERDRGDVVFYKTLDDMMRRARLDGLFIGTRCNLHVPYAIQAAKYNIPLFLEKPVAINMRQARGLETVYEKAKLPVVVSFPLRVSPLCTMARRLIKDGAAGKPEHITGLNYVPYGTIYWEEGYRNYNITQGLFLQKATHDFDYMMFLMGSNIVRVAAMANWGRVFGGKKRSGLVCSKCSEQWQCRESPQNRLRNGSGGSLKDHPCDFNLDCGSPRTGMNEDCSSALFEFASGAHGIYTQVFFARRDAAARGATLSGYLGTVSFDWYKNELKRVRHHEPFTDTLNPAGGASHFGGDNELALNFLDVIQGRAKSLTPITAGIQSVYACLAAKESSLKGRFVKVRQVGAVN